MRNWFLFAALAVAAIGTALGVWILNRPSHQDVGLQQHYIIGLSPNYERGRREEAFKTVVMFLVRDMPIGSTFVIYDAWGTREVTRGDVPNVAGYRAPPGGREPSRPRVALLREQGAALRAFMLEPAPTANKVPPNGIDTVAFLERVGQFLIPDKRKSAIILVGEPIYDMEGLPEYSFKDGFFPNDVHITVPREASIFSTAGRETSLRNLQVHWATMTPEPATAASHDQRTHRTKVNEFWAKYIASMGGQLGAYDSNLNLVFGEASQGRSSYRTAAPLDLSDARPIMISIQRTNPEKIIRDLLFTDTRTVRQEYDQVSPLKNRAGNARVGIAWECQDCDMDLYVSADPRNLTDELSWARRRTTVGAFWKDFAPRDVVPAPINGYEYVELQQASDIRAIQAAINFYSGNSPGGVHGTLRVEAEGRVFASEFFVPAESGNRGVDISDRRRSNHWKVIQLGEILPAQ